MSLMPLLILGTAVFNDQSAGQPFGHSLKLAKRHGLIAGVAVFAADIKGDLCGLGAPDAPRASWPSASPPRVCRTSPRPIRSPAGTSMARVVIRCVPP